MAKQAPPQPPKPSEPKNRTHRALMALSPAALGLGGAFMLGGMPRRNVTNTPPGNGAGSGPNGQGTADDRKR